MNDFIALCLSLLFILLVLASSWLLMKLVGLSPAVARKVVHIGVSHWWLLYIALFASAIVGMAGVLAFVVINTIAYRYQLSRMSSKSEPPKNLGIIWFPLSLALLIGLELLGIVQRWEAGIGVLVLGWGDGMAGLVGQKLSRRPIRVFQSMKSLVGTCSLVVGAFGVTLLMTLFFSPALPLPVALLRALATALFAALVELGTPFGLDNLSLPILTALFYRFLAMNQLEGLFAAALALNMTFAFVAYFVKAVDGGGAVIGAALGTIILSAGGIQAYILLGGFFFSSTILGRIKSARHPANDIEAKGSRRDALQVVANAGWSAIASIIYAVTRNDLCLVALVTSLAAATSDTWASEIGALSKRQPFSILTGKQVPAGASGGVSILGFAASASGACFIGLLFTSCEMVFPLRPAEWGVLAFIAVVFGFLGSLVDSVLGAAFQARYRCVVSGRYTERSHTMGQPNPLIGGLRWCTNDVVNFASTGIVALAALFFYALSQ